MLSARNATFLGLVALFALGIFHVVLYWFYQPDDAFIYSVYVKNWVSGGGLTFNGELVEGFSSVSWTLLSAMIAWWGVEPLQAAKYLGLASYMGAAALLLLVHRRLEGFTQQWPGLALLSMFFSFPLLALWGPAAMEGILFALLLVASCYFCFLAFDTSQVRYFALLGAIFGGLAVTRPEGGAFFGAILAYTASRLLLRKRVSWGGVVVSSMVFLLIVGLLLLWRYSMFGELFPTTVSAKTGNLTEQIRVGIGYVSRFAAEYFYLILPYLLATALLIRRGGGTGWWAWLVFIHVGGYFAFNILVGGDWMIGYRFLMPVVPLMISTCALALCGLPRSAALLPLAFAGYSVWLSTQLYTEARTERMATEGDVIMGKHIAEMQLPPDSRIAVVDAGAIPYFSGLPTIDMVGLNNQHISRLPGGFMQKWDNDYVLSLKPKVIQLHTYRDPASGELMPSPDFRGSQLLFYTQEFQRWYELDPTSLVPQLFVRREYPKSIDEGFFAFESEGHLSADRSSLQLRLKKKGSGIWERHADDQHAVGWRVSVVDNAGQDMTHSFLPLTRRLAQNEEVSLEVPMPTLGEGSYRVLACPVFNQVAQFPQCNGGFVVDLPLHEDVQAIKGVAGFSDPRLSFGGWSTPEPSHRWSLGRASELTFVTGDVANLKGELDLDLASFGLQNIKLMMNGAEIFSGQANGEKVINLRNVSYRDGRNVLRILTPDARAPGSNDERMLGVALRSIRIE
ncbi:hypothetical protein IB234_07060 [Pseudomonas sp. PDM16]|uniref:hypothetical protein n=1 Tax=Pseudomonas sp. PDM16 TaxID=2769292 RepID=UPI001785FCC7|nr:hypothetical protein [Pseudomonas sp. PDM16]MBD9414316.1 hypothetical protein [Pseudomonas sp. PDM16]